MDAIVKYKYLLIEISLLCFRYANVSGVFVILRAIYVSTYDALSTVLISSEVMAMSVKILLSFPVFVVCAYVLVII